MLRRDYEIISLNDAKDFSYSDFQFKDKRYGMLLTFDDGLSDHYTAAMAMAEYGIKGVFFIPTCILTDNMPANPTIIHYSLARYGINGFLKAYHNALEEYKIDIGRYGIMFRKGLDDPWETIKKIKGQFKHGLRYVMSRRVLLHIYRNLLLPDYPNVVEIMHLTKRQLKDMVAMGHSLGVHSHTHISVAAVNLEKDDFQKEMISPKRYLSKAFNASVYALSYPFGNREDCFDSKALINRTREYKLAFTVENVLNTAKRSPFELGRYMPTSSDDASRLERKLRSIIKNNGDGR